MSALPQGTVTFLFSDVEGSTRLARQLGDRHWAELLESHRAMLRQAFAAHSGLEVDTQGDSFFVAFTRATDALAAALDAQRAPRIAVEKGRVGVRRRAQELAILGRLALRTTLFGHSGEDTADGRAPHRPE